MADKVSAEEMIRLLHQAATFEEGAGKIFLQKAGAEG